MYSSIRTFTMIVAPLIYSAAYARSQGGTGFGGLPWIVAAVLGAVVPECLHRSLTDKELELPPAS